MTQRQATWKNKAKGDACIRLASSPVRMSGVDAAPACLYLQGAEPGYFCSAHTGAVRQGLSHPYQCCTKSHRFLPILWGGILDLKKSYRNVFWCWSFSHNIFLSPAPHMLEDQSSDFSPKHLLQFSPASAERWCLSHEDTSNSSFCGYRRQIKIFVKARVGAVCGAPGSHAIAAPEKTCWAPGGCCLADFIYQAGLLEHKKAACMGKKGFQHIRCLFILWICKEGIIRGLLEQGLQLPTSSVLLALIHPVIPMSPVCPRPGQSLVLWQAGGTAERVPGPMAGGRYRQAARELTPWGAQSLAALLAGGGSSKLLWLAKQMFGGGAAPCAGLARYKVISILR